MLLSNQHSTEELLNKEILFLPSWVLQTGEYAAFDSKRCYVSVNCVDKTVFKLVAKYMVCFSGNFEDVAVYRNFRNWISDMFLCMLYLEGTMILLFIQLCEKNFFYL